MREQSGATAPVPSVPFEGSTVSANVTTKRAAVGMVSTPLGLNAAVSRTRAAALNPIGVSEQRRSIGRALGTPEAWVSGSGVIARLCSLTPTTFEQDNRHVCSPAGCPLPEQRRPHPLVPPTSRCAGPVHDGSGRPISDHDPSPDRVLDKGSGLRGRSYGMVDPWQPLRGRRRVRRHHMGRMVPRARSVRPLPACVHGAAAGADGGGGVRLEERRLLGNDRAARDMRRMASVNSNERGQK